MELKAELIQKLEAHPDVKEQVLIPGLEIPSNTTGSVNTRAILDDPILDDKTPVLQPAQNCIAKSIKKSKILVIGCWTTYRQNQRWLMKLSNHLRIKLKNCKTKETLPSN